MKQIIYIQFLFSVLIILSINFSCSDMDEYLKYVDDGPIHYTGKVDSVTFYSGEERVVFSGLLQSDPNITQVKIFWNLRKESVTLDVERTDGIDSLSYSIPLPENQYDFEVISYNKKGEPSIVVNAIGRSYGSVYKKTIYNRTIKSFKRLGGNLIIEWYNGDEDSPLSRLSYVDKNGKTVIIDVPTKEEETIIVNYPLMTELSIQTYFLPDKAAIDTFKVEKEVVFSKIDDSQFLIKNPGDPFLKAGITSNVKWDNIKDWTISPNVQNQIGNTVGCWSWDYGGIIHIESKDWGGPGFTNGKIYQTLSEKLPATEKEFQLEFEVIGGGGDFKGGYFAIVEGAEMLDIDKIEDDAIAYYKWDKLSSGTYSLKFKLDSPKQVTIGWVLSIGSSTYIQIKKVKMLYLKN